MERYKAMSHLSLKEMVRECSNGTISYAKMLSAFEKANRHNIHEVFRYQKFQEDFVDVITCYSDGKHVLGYIGASYTEFLKKLSHILNVKTEEKENEETDSKFNERLEDLKHIRIKEQLMEEFPVIYQDYANGFAYLREMRKEENPDKRESKRHYYFSCGLRKGFSNFIESQYQVYERFVSRRREYENRIHSRSFNALVRKYCDVSKVAMYVVHTYLLICENTEDESILLEYLPVIQNYMEKSKYEKTGYIRIHHELVDYESISARYQVLKERIQKQKKEVYWQLVPNGKEYPESLKKSGKERKLEMSDTEYRRLYAKGIEKQKFYESTPYLARVVGTLKYEGYMAYIYPNGEVILDRAFQEENISSAVGDAIYHLKAVDFELLSQCDKTTLKNHPKVERIIHSKYWKSKVRHIILQEGNKEDQEEAKKLIRRLENQN